MASQGPHTNRQLRSKSVPKATPTTAAAAKQKKAAAAAAAVLRKHQAAATRGTKQRRGKLPQDAACDSSDDEEENDSSSDGNDNASSEDSEQIEDQSAATAAAAAESLEEDSSEDEDTDNDSQQQQQQQQQENQRSSRRSQRKKPQQQQQRAAAKQEIPCSKPGKNRTRAAGRTAAAEAAATGVISHKPGVLDLGDLEVAPGDDVYLALDNYTHQEEEEEACEVRQKCLAWTKCLLTVQHMLSTSGQGVMQQSVHDSQSPLGYVISKPLCPPVSSGYSGI